MADAFERARTWMFDEALPLWATKGVDHAHGGFVEILGLDGRDACAPFKRTRVTCRQIYVFAHAAELGWTDGLPHVAAGVDYLTTRTWMPGAGAFARRLSREGDVLDPTIDLYDHAFVLFALGWAYRATKDSQALAWAHRTLDAVEQHLTHPGGEGFLHETPAQGWRQQNPHMHMLEASLALFEATGERRFGDLAERLGKLFAKHFYDPASTTLAEFFTETWARAPGEDGRRTEPGHQFEWAWILVNLHRLTGVDQRTEARGLVSFADRFGVDPATGATINAVRDDGAPLDRRSRTWPNTERIKAAVALYEMDGVDPRPAIEASTSLLMDRYFAPAPRGQWIDQLDEAGAPMLAASPASTLYHVFLAFAEMLRIQPKVVA
ncbi:mannose-6-phosphate isomerase [bacterium]|nr:mannose-6-phosphate isomerase [bacterium]